MVGSCGRYPTRRRSAALPAGLPSTVTVPDVVIWVPTMQRISVVFPHPDGPSRPVMLPFAISTEKSCSAGRLPRITRRWLMLTAGSEPPGINSRVMKSSYDEYAPLARRCQARRNRQVVIHYLGSFDGPETPGYCHVCGTGRFGGWLQAS